MKQDFLTNFITKAKEEQERVYALEKRKNHFKTIGRKGGLAKKQSAKYSKIISTKVTEKELKINEFKTDEVLLRYGNHFIRITNLLRNREWNEFENKKQILEEIQTATKLIREYLYQKIIENEQFGNDEED